MPCTMSVAFHLPSWLQDAAECGFPVETEQQHIPQGCPFLPPQLDASVALGECQQRCLSGAGEGAVPWLRVLSH